MTVHLALTTTLFDADTVPLFEYGKSLWTATPRNTRWLGFIVHCGASANPFAPSPELATRARILKHKYIDTLRHTYTLTSALRFKNSITIFVTQEYY